MPPAAPGEPSPRRALPDYDGRGEPPSSAGDGALWVPRVIFSPAYLVSEFLIRRPLGALITAAERGQWQVALFNFFASEDHRYGVVPTALVDFGLKPSVGLYAFYDDAFVKGNDLRAHFGFWGPEWISVGLADRVKLTPGSTVAFSGSVAKRPDRLFYGLGARSQSANRSRFDSTTVDLAAEADVALRGWSRFRARSGFRGVSFGPETCCDDPSVAQRFSTLPPGMATGYGVVYQELELVLDGRRKRPAPQHGVRVDLSGTHAVDLGNHAAREFVNYGGTAAGYLDLGRARVVALKLTARFADPISRGEVPFTEQVILGGSGAMRGYLFGRLTGRSAAVAELEYRWPIWVWLDGTMHVALGNVFDAHLKDFETKLLRLSSGIGIRTVGSPDHMFEFLTGFGTETIEDGLRVSSFRLVIGGTRGF